MQEEIARLSEPYLKATTIFITTVRRRELPNLEKSSGEKPDWEKSYRVGQGNFWIALVNRNVIGTVGLLDLGGGRGCLQRMYVHADYRGTGTALRLLNTLIEWAVTCQMREIYLGTFSEQRAAQRFYEKHGFCRILEKGIPTNLPRSAIEDCFYRCSLTAR